MLQNSQNKVFTARRKFTAWTVAILLLAGYSGCARSTPTSSETLGGESDAWKLRKLTVSPPPYDCYRIAPGDFLGVHDAVRIIVDNGSTETVMLHLPGDNTLPISNGSFVVLEAEARGFHFGVSSPTQSRRDFQHDLQSANSGSLTTYVFNYRGLNSYRLEKHTYEDLPIGDPIPDETYEVDGQEWFQVRFTTVDYFFAPFPTQVTDNSPSYLPPTGFATRVRIARK